VNEIGDARIVFRGIAGSFEIQADDFEALRVIAAVEIDKEGSFVAAVRAPGTTDGEKNDFAGEARIGVGDDLPVEIGELELEGLGGIGHAAEACGIGRFGNAFSLGIGNARGDVLIQAIVSDRECAVGLQLSFEKDGTFAGEVA